MNNQRKQPSIRVAVNGFGVIGKRVAAAIQAQADMTLVGVADVFSDWRLDVVGQQGHALFAATRDAAEAMSRVSGTAIEGTLEDLLPDVDVVIDCTPKGIGAANADIYRNAGIKFIVQGGEKHEVAGHSFVADANFDGAVGRDATRVVSCNTTSIVRTLSCLSGAVPVERARGTLLRRATDPWESHLGGIMNTLVPELEVPSHQAPDAQKILVGMDLTTVAVKVPETLAHMHTWFVTLERTATREEVLSGFQGSSRTLLVEAGRGLGALNAVVERMLDLGRPHGNLYEVALWSDLLRVSGRELCYSYMVDNQAIVVPENVDAVRALCGGAPDARTSMQWTDRSLGIG